MGTVIAVSLGFYGDSHDTLIVWLESSSVIHM